MLRVIYRCKDIPFIWRLLYYCYKNGFDSISIFADCLVGLPFLQKVIVQLTLEQVNKCVRGYFVHFQ